MPIRVPSCTVEQVFRFLCTLTDDELALPKQQLADRAGLSRGAFYECLHHLTEGKFISLLSTGIGTPSKITINKEVGQPPSICPDHPDRRSNTKDTGQPPSICPDRRPNTKNSGEAPRLSDSTSIPPRGSPIGEPSPPHRGFPFASLRENQAQQDADAGDEDKPKTRFKRDDGTIITLQQLRHISARDLTANEVSRILDNHHPGSRAIRKSFLAGVADAIEAVYQIKWGSAYNIRPKSWRKQTTSNTKAAFQRAAEMWAREFIRRKMDIDTFIEASNEMRPKAVKFITPNMLGGPSNAEKIQAWIPYSERDDNPLKGVPALVMEPERQRWWDVMEAVGVLQNWKDIGVIKDLMQEDYTVLRKYGIVDGDDRVDAARLGRFLDGDGEVKFPLPDLN